MKTRAGLRPRRRRRPPPLVAARPPLGPAGLCLSKKNNKEASDSPAVSSNSHRVSLGDRPRMREQ